LALDCKLRLQGEVRVAIGAANRVDVDLREAFRALVLERAVAALFVHNHPSGDPTPSADDYRLSKRLVAAGQVLGIRVVDHVIIGRDGYASALHGGPVARPPPDATEAAAP
jgi:DNA repair protein RadC